MVQREQVIKVFSQIAGRIALLFIAIGVSFFFFPISLHEFTVEILDYKRPPGFFGFTFADWGVSYSLAQALWVGVIFGVIGKKIDYIFITIFFLFMSLNHFFTANMTWVVYLAFVSFAVFGVLVGFGLKLLRQKIWK